MAEARKTLGQAFPSAGALTTVYTVPASTSAIVSTIVVCNQSSTLSAKYRISIAIAGTADIFSQYIAYDGPLQPNESYAFTLGITLATTDVIRVYDDTGLVSFNVFGIEIT